MLEAAFADLAGTPQRLDQWRGKVLVVNFWATWCPPCLKEIPEFIRMQNRYREQGLQFVGIAVDQPDRVAAFADEMRFNYPVLVGALEAVVLLRALGNQHGGLPFTVVFDRSGAIVATELGAFDEPKLSRAYRTTSVTFAAYCEISARRVLLAGAARTGRTVPNCLKLRGCQPPPRSIFSSCTAPI